MAAKIGVDVSFKDTGLRKLFEDLDRFTKLETTVGYHEPTPVEGSSLTVPELAAIQEYGTRNIPARPFMRRAAKEAGPAIEEVAGEAIADLVNNGVASPVRVMDQVGDVAAARVLEQLLTTDSWATPNAPYTLARKVGTTPLYAGHGRLRDELKYAVNYGDTQLLLEKPRGQ